MPQPLATLTLDGPVAVELPVEQPAETKSPTAPLTTGPVSLNRDVILDATEHCLTQAGYDGTTVRTIAKRLGCAVGSIYRHFADKRDLLSAVADRHMQPVATLAAGSADLKAVCHAYLDAARAKPQVYHLLFWLASVRDEPAVPQAVDQVIASLTERLGSAQHAAVAWSLLHGAATVGGEASLVAQAINALRPTKPTARKRRPDSKPKTATKTAQSNAAHATEGDGDDVCLL